MSSLNIEEVKQVVESIKLDMEKLKWIDTTPKGSSAFSLQDAKAFTATGHEWTHHLVTWKEGVEDRCDGTATNLRKFLIVRYTPEIAKLALEAVQRKP